VHLRLHYLDELGRDSFMCVSAHIGFLTGIKQRPLPQLVTDHMSKVNGCKGPEAHQNKVILMIELNPCTLIVGAPSKNPMVVRTSA
jgi:hypothetical protein